MKKAQFTDKYMPYILILPQIIIILIFFVWPLIRGIYDSLMAENAFGTSSHFVWFQNYENAIFNSDYYRSMKFTLIFSFFITIISLSTGLLLAYKTNNLMKSKGLYRTLFVWPYAVAPPVIGLIATFLFNESNGALYYFLHKIGWRNFDPVNNPLDAQIVLIFAASWKEISADFIFFLAGLQSIPKSVVEASKIDCKSDTKRFWTIIFPLLSPTTFFLLTTNIAYSFFDTFGLIDTTTKGSPMGETETLVYKIYQDGFLGANVGGSSAQSVMLFLLVLVITFFQFKCLEKRVHY